MLYALLTPTVILLVWAAFEGTRGRRKAPSYRTPSTEWSQRQDERPPAPAPMRRHRPF